MESKCKKISAMSNTRRGNLKVSSAINRSAKYVATSLCLAIIVLSGAASPQAHAKSTGAKKELLGNASGLTHETFTNTMKDGKPLIDAWLKASQSYPSYQFDYQMTVYKD